MQRALGTARVWNVVVKEPACLRGRLKFTLMCTFLVKAESGGYQTWIYGRYEERLAQQESGAALSNSSTYVSGLLLYKVCIN